MGLDAVVVADEGVRSTVDDGLRTINSTSDTTIAAAASAAAQSATAALRVRYHGTGAGLKFQVVASNASKASAAGWAVPSGPGAVSPGVSGAASAQR